MIINSSKQCFPSSPANLGLQHISHAKSSDNLLDASGISWIKCSMALRASQNGGGREGGWEGEGCVHQLLKTLAEVTSALSLEELGFQASDSPPSPLLAQG